MLDDRTLADHRTMLEDNLRLSAYRRAIEAICPGHVVAEIGVGLGPLSLFALRAGARRVYGIEVDARTLEVATALMRAHGYDSDRFVPVCGRSDEVTLPERVDVVLSELLDSIGVGENVLHYLDDARRRHLRPGGTMIPRRLAVDVALAESMRFAAERRFWTHDLRLAHGLDYGPVASQMIGPRRSLEVGTDELRSGWTRWLDVDFERDAPPPPQTSLELVASTTGVAEGIAVAFEADLGAGASLRTHSGAPRTHWHQGWLPLPVTIPVVAGQRLVLDLSRPATDAPWAPVEAVLDLLEEGVGTESVTSDHN